MENIKLIIDSSSNLTSDPKENLTVVPLTISFGGKDYLDNDQLDIPNFLKEMTSNKIAGKTSCPSINEWLQALDGVDKAIIITMTSAMSGTYSSALQARDIYLESHPLAQIIIVDSRSAGPELAVVTEGIEQLVHADIRFVDLEQRIAELRTRTHLVFVLQSLHNLSLNGRVSSAVAKMAGMLHINIVGMASKEGKLESLAKCRGIKKTLKEVVKQMLKLNYQGGRVIIDYCQNEQQAQDLKEKLLAQFPAAKISLRPMHGLCSFYAEEGGLMVGFHE